MKMIDRLIYWYFSPQLKELLMLVVNAGSLVKWVCSWRCWEKSCIRYTTERRHLTPSSVEDVPFSSMTHLWMFDTPANVKIRTKQRRWGADEDFLTGWYRMCVISIWMFKMKVGAQNKDRLTLLHWCSWKDSSSPAASVQKAQLLIQE